jgi:hypothetical protein
VGIDLEAAVNRILTADEIAADITASLNAEMAKLPEADREKFLAKVLDWLNAMNGFPLDHDER